MTDRLHNAVIAAFDDYFGVAPTRPELPRSLRLVSAPSGRRNTARAVAVASGLTAAAGITGVFVGANRNSSGPGSPSALTTTVVTEEAGTSADSAAAEDTGVQTDESNPGFELVDVPADFAVVQVVPAVTLSGLPERPEGGMAWFILGRRDANGAVVVKIDVSIAYGKTFGPPPGSGYTREAITIAGVPGEIVRSDSGDWVVVEYQWGEQAVMVMGNVGDDESMLADMIQIANDVNVDEATAELGAPLPDGLELLTSGPWQAEADNSEPTTIYYSDTNRIRSISVKFEVDPPDDFQFWFMGDDLVATTVRDHPGFVTNRPGSYGPGDESDPSIMWLERPDLMVTVSGIGDVTIDEVVAAAESLRPLSDAAWRELLSRSDDGVDSAATTAAIAEPASSVELSTTTSG